MDLNRDVYQLTGMYPKSELFGLTSQTNRAVVSIAANIAEGMGRNSKKDTLHFLHISRGSLYELEALLNIAVRVDLIEENQFHTMVPLIDKIAKLLSGLINYFQKSSLQ